MFKELSRITLNAILDIVRQIKLYSHEFDSFDTEGYRNSDLREVLKEEYLRVVFYEKIKNLILGNLTDSDGDLVRWTKIIADKEYVRDTSKKCDLYLEGEVIKEEEQYFVYKRDFRKRAWIELKYLTPTNDAPAKNSVNIVKDILRVLFLSDDYVESDRYVIVVVLCGRYGRKLKDISKYFLKNKFFNTLFFPSELNPDRDFVMNFKEFLSECTQSSSIFRDKITPLENKIRDINYDLVYFRRMIISPFHFYEEKQLEDFDKQVIGYIFRLKGYRTVKN